MFKPWKKEKIKIKAVFKLQFQVTQVPKLKGKGLMISLVPADVGKPTVRLRKAPIVEGTCTWENPIFETVKLIKETKTGIFKEKVYYFDVSTGSSRKGFLGETAINFAEFAEASNAFIVSLPLDASESGPLLHITVEKMQGEDNLRDGGENEALGSESLDGSLRNQMEDCNGYGNSNLDFIEDDNVNKETSQEADVIPKRIVDVIPTEKVLHHRSITDWSLGSASDGSIMDTANSPEESFSNNPVDLLKMEICKLERQAEISDMELQSLRKQIVKESKRGQDLSQKVVSLKEENEALNAEREQLKSAPNKSNKDNDNSELVKREKDLNKRLRSQLYKTEDSNSELVLAVKDLNKKLEQKDTEISLLSSKIKDSDEAKMIEELFSEIEVMRKEKEELSMDFEKLGAEYEASKLENHNISSMLEEKRLEHVNMQNEYSETLVTLKEYKGTVQRLEKKIKIQNLEALESLDKIDELEDHVKSLENKLEKRTKDFEDDSERWSKEREAHDKEFDLLKKEAEEKLEAKSSALRDLKDEKEVIVGTLQSEIKSLKFQYDELKHCLSKSEIEKENLRTQVSKLESELGKKEASITSLTEKVISLKETIGLNEAKLKGSSKQDFAKVPVKSKAESYRDAKPKASNFHVNDASNFERLSTEMSLLKERNKDMEVELKEMQEKYSDVSLRFAEVEGERQHLVMTLRNLKNGKK